MITKIYKQVYVLRLPDGFFNLNVNGVMLRGVRIVLERHPFKFLVTVVVYCRCGHEVCRLEIPFKSKGSTCKFLRETREVLNEKD